MLDKLIGEHGHGYGNGYGHKDHRSSGYGFEEHKQYASHMESEGGYFDRQARYDHHVRLPPNHGRPPMAHMPPCDEDDSVEEFYKSSRSNHTTVLPHHGKSHHQQPPHMNYMSPPPMSQPYPSGKVGNGWQGKHEDAYHGGHGEHGMKQHGAYGMKHHDRLMAPQAPPHHLYMNPSHGTGRGHAVVVNGSENWSVGGGGGHYKAGWGSKGL